MFEVKFSALIWHKVYSTPPSFSIDTTHIHIVHPFLSEKRTCMELRVPYIRWDEPELHDIGDTAGTVFPTCVGMLLPAP